MISGVITTGGSGVFEPSGFVTSMTSLSPGFASFGTFITTFVLLGSGSFACSDLFKVWLPSPSFVNSTAGGLITSGITLTESSPFSLSFPWKFVIVASTFEVLFFSTGASSG